MIDMFMVAAKTGRRSEFMLFTAPFISMPGIIMMLSGSAPGQYQRKGPGRQEGGGCGRLFLARLSQGISPRNNGRALQEHARGPAESG